MISRRPFPCRIAPQYEVEAPAWMSTFIGLEVLIAVRGCTDSGTCYSFKVLEESQLYRTKMEPKSVPACHFQRVGIVGRFGKQWPIDPSPVATAEGWCTLWLWERRPFCLQWDPVKWISLFCPPITQAFPSLSSLLSLVSTFKRDRVGLSHAAEHKLRQGCTMEFLPNFLDRVCHKQRPRRVSIFIWLIAHQGMAVGV